MAIPDNSNTATASVEQRGDFVLGPGLTFLEPKQSWRLQVVFLPVAENLVAYRMAKDGEDFPTTWRTTAAKNAKGPDAVYPGPFRPGLARLGDSTNKDFIPEAAALVPKLVGGCTSIRRTHCGFTMILNANAFTDQGIVSAGQWSDRPIVTQVTGWRAQMPEGGHEQAWDALAFKDLPANSNELVQKCAAAGQWEARKGIYMPIRFDDPVHLYSAAGASEVPLYLNAGTMQKPGFPILISTSGRSEDVENVRDDYLYTYKRDGEEPSFVITTAGAVNGNVGMAIWEGLDPKATILLRFRAGLQEAPSEDNPLASACLPAPATDEQAVKMVHEVGRRLPVVYEHKFNSLNLLLPALKSLVKTVAPTVLPWLTKRIEAW